MMSEELTTNEITRETCYVPATHKAKGRHIAVTPGETAARYLHYGRIRLDANDAAFRFNNSDHETGLICLNGAGRISTGGETFKLMRYDALYVPRVSEIEVEAEGDE